MSDTFPQKFERHGLRYTLLAPLTTTRAHFQFEGPFDGQEIVWDAELLALGNIPASGHAGRRAYIDIGESGPQGRSLQVGLNVAALDEAVVLRTIIMIRQYRRLRPGRMLFGEGSALP